MRIYKVKDLSWNRQDFGTVTTWDAYCPYPADTISYHIRRDLHDEDVTYSVSKISSEDNKSYDCDFGLDCLSQAKEWAYGDYLDELSEMLQEVEYVVRNKNDRVG